MICAPVKRFSSVVRHSICFQVLCAISSLLCARAIVSGQLACKSSWQASWRGNETHKRWMCMSRDYRMAFGGSNRTALQEFFGKVQQGLEVRPENANRSDYCSEYNYAWAKGNTTGGEGGRKVKGHSRWRRNVIKDARWSRTDGPIVTRMARS